MNNYGIRLLEPFSPRWFYGDTLFIIDAVLWTVLPLGIWLSRRREAAGREGWQRPAQAVLAFALVYIWRQLCAFRQGGAGDGGGGAGDTRHRRRIW